MQPHGWGVLRGYLDEPGGVRDQRRDYRGRVVPGGRTHCGDVRSGSPRGQRGRRDDRLHFRGGCFAFPQGNFVRDLSQER